LDVILSYRLYRKTQLLFSRRGSHRLGACPKRDVHLQDSVVADWVYPPGPMSDDPIMLICTEGGYLEKQSLLLVRSLRRFGGSLCDMQVHSFAPRPGRGISRETAAEF
jgi:hypothetical protein